MSEITLSSYLNEDFYSYSFSAKERKAILKTTLDNSNTGNPEWNTVGGADTEDHIFLLSYEDISKKIPYFKTLSNYKVKSTTFAKKTGAEFLFTTDWWLRSPGKKQDQAAYVSSLEIMNSIGADVPEGVRPALWIDLNAGFSKFNYARYQKLEKLYRKRRWEDALDMAEKIYESGLDIDSNYFNTYLDTERYYFSSINRCYLFGCELSDDYELDLLSLYFYDLDDEEFWQSVNYLYSIGMDISEDCYETAIDCIELEDYEKATSLLTYLGNYRDSTDLLKVCYDHTQTDMYYFSAEPVNTGKDNGYSGTKAIGKKDPHYGWSMGDFFMGGFTDVIDPSSDNPIFLKTVDDSITLSFHLLQEIDALNGNKKLCLSADDNGYDQYFSTPELGFGKGTLIVRMTNYQNRRLEPQIYTDYLLGEGRSDTNITLHEEGDYEVALDYELLNRKGVNSYSNYRIYFRFSVRNGNCMIFPRDAETGSELKNTSRAKNGFFLDLAKSRYLTIHVTRSELVEESSGVTEDIRFSRPARDGDYYTAPGIYTIKVSNPYTGEFVTKTIFVGSKKLLNEYVDNGFSLKRLE